VVPCASWYISAENAEEKGFFRCGCAVSAGMQNVQRAGEHSGRGGRKEKPAEDRPEAPRPKKMKLGSASGAASGGARGSGRMAQGGALAFEAARMFARTLKLGSREEWKEYNKSGKRPSNIPSNPDRTYRDAGWVSWPDWLGFEGKQRKQNGKGSALSFEAARTFVRSLKLGSAREREEYSKSGKRPSNIPSNPDKTYRDAGWVSYPNWLGYEGKEGLARGGALSFEAARTFVRTLKLRSHKEWKEYRKSGKRPSNITSNPDKVYRH
jgi:hypothetical protein